MQVVNLGVLGEQVPHGHLRPTRGLLWMSHQCHQCRVTGAAFSRVSSPIWWLSCVIFLVSLQSLFRDFFRLLCRSGRTRCWMKDRVRRAASVSSPSSPSLGGDPETLQALVLPSCSPWLCSLARVAGDDLIVLAKPQSLCREPLPEPPEGVSSLCRAGSRAGTDEQSREGTFPTTDWFR